MWLKLSAADTSPHKDMEISVAFRCFQSAEVFWFGFWFFGVLFCFFNSFSVLVKLKR